MARRVAVLVFAIVVGFAAPAHADGAGDTYATGDYAEPSPLGVVSFEVLPDIWFEGTAEELGQVVNYLLHVRSVNEFLEWHYRYVRGLR